MEDEQLTELHIVNGLHPTLPWRYYPRSLQRAEGGAAERLAQGVHRDRDPLLREDLRPAGLRDPRRADRRRPGVADRRRRRDLRLGGPAAHRRPPHPLGGLVAHPPARAREGPQDPVRRCCTATSRSRGTASTTCCACASCRTRPAASRSSSRCATSTTSSTSTDGKVRNRLQARTTMATPRRVAEDLRGLPAAVRQRAARQGASGSCTACRSRSSSLQLRRRRPGRLGRRVQDHPRRRQLRHAEQACTATTCWT